jgi:hypothetical protein
MGQMKLFNIYIYHNSKNVCLPRNMWIYHPQCGLNWETHLFCLQSENMLVDYLAIYHQNVDLTCNSYTH